MCKYEGCDYFPQYGVGPHTHDLSNGSFLNSTVPLQKVDWPKNYREDTECPGLGTYYCPECLDGMVKASVS
jgi:hypothetical protein